MVKTESSGLLWKFNENFILFDESGEFSNLNVGDKVTTTVLELENENGQLELSFRQAGHKKAWEKLDCLHWSISKNPKEKYMKF